MKKQTIFSRLRDGIKGIFGDPVSTPAYQMLLNKYNPTRTLSDVSYEDWVTYAFKNNEVVNKALSLISTSVAEGTIYVYDNDGNILEKHPTNQLLQHINSSDNQVSFIKQILLSLYLGDVFFVEKVRSKKGTVAELGVLRPDKVEIVTDGISQITHYIYRPDGATEIKVPKDKIIFGRFINPLDRLSGYSPLKSLSMRIDTDNEQSKHVLSVLQNGGVVGNVLKVPEDISQDQAETLLKDFNRRTTGAKKGSTLVLRGGIDFESFGSNLQELEAKELAKINEAKILSALGIPLPVFGGISGTDSSTYDNMKTAMKMFWRQTIVPLQNMLIAILEADKDLLSDKDIQQGNYLAFDNSEVEALKEDQDLLSSRARADYQSGLITKNEARILGGYEPIDGGDEFYATFGIADMAPPQDTVAVKAIPADIIEEIKSVSLKDACSCCPEVDCPIRPSAEMEYKVASKRMALADSYNIKLYRMAKKHLNKHIKDTIKLLKSDKSKHTLLFTRKGIGQDVINSLLGSLVTTWTQELQEDSGELMTDLIGKAAIQAAAELNFNLDIQDERILAAIQRQQFKFANKVSNTSADKIKVVLEESIKEGKSIEGTVMALEELSKQFGAVRAEMIARTETVRAANEGARHGYKSAGVEKLMYSAILDDKTSDICHDLNGKVVSINEPFFSGDVYITQDGNKIDTSYDGGVPYPPAHPNCRSTIIPIIE